MDSPPDIADEYDFIDHDETWLTPKDIAKIRDWLQPTDYLAESGEFQRHLSSQAPGTGLWICQTEEYQTWHDSSDHASLWIKGVPGAGKSVVAASIIQHLQSTETCPVLFFFFRNIVAANFSPRALLRDWLAQLLPYSPKLQFILKARLESSLAEYTDSDLFQLFLDGASCVSKVYCVGDALDEMGADNRPFLDKLNSLARHRPASLKLLMTSRPKQYLQSALRDTSIVHISLQQQLVDVDITAYLNHRFDRFPRSDATRNIKPQLLEMVARRSEGLFLYAKLAMDQLEAALADNGARVDVQALEASLPTGLEQTYTNLLLKHRRESEISPDLQILILEMVTHASRPLRLSELASLIKVLSPDTAAPAGFKALISTCCGPLIEVLEEETLQVIHHSFTEFLRGETRNSLPEDAESSHNFPVINTRHAHKQMAINCLRYLQSGSLLLEHEHQEKKYFDYQEARLQHPFLGYAMDNWAYHASFYDVQDEEFFGVVTEFAKPDNVAFRRWLSVKWFFSDTTCSKPAATVPTVLHVAAFGGLSELCLDLIQHHGASVGVTDQLGCLPIHWAAENGHLKVASVLIQHQSDPDPEDLVGVKPIHLAAWRGHSAIVKLLCEAGATPNSITTVTGKKSDEEEVYRGRWSQKGRKGGGGGLILPGESAIFYASKCGHIDTILAIIPFCTPGMLEQLLCECCWFDRTDCVLAILENSDVSADATYLEGTALHHVVRSANVKCVEALIRRGADVCKTSEWGPRRDRHGNPFRPERMRAPLHKLIHVLRHENFEECYKILHMLIDAGADIEQTDGFGNTPLLSSARTVSLRDRHVQIVQTLLDAGADVTKTTRQNGTTALHDAMLAQADADVIVTLLAHGSDPNHKSPLGKTALHFIGDGSNSYWSKHNFEKTAKVARHLLDWGADPSTRDCSGCSALQKSIGAGPEVFSMLLSKCVDRVVKLDCWFSLATPHWGIDPRGESAFTPESFVQYIEIFLAQGIEIDTKREEDGRTLFLCCAQSPQKLRILQTFGAKTDAVDNDGRNALHIQLLQHVYSQERSEALQRPLQELIDEFGLDPLSRDHSGNTLLHHVAAVYTRSKLHLVRWLLSLGIPVNAVNGNGSTALHVYQEKGFVPYHNNYSLDCHLIHAINEESDVGFEIRDNNGLTPLHMAAMRSEMDVSMLVAFGANLIFLTGDGQNVLHLACRARRSNIAALVILEHPGAIDVDQKDSFGRTPLHYACGSGDPELVALLLKHAADVHAVAEDGYTPLHACALSKVEQIVWVAKDLSSTRPWLRGPPANPLRPLRPSLRTTSECAWYHEGAFTFSRNPFSAAGVIAKMLLDAGSDPAVMANGCTALDLALDYGCSEIVEIFYQDEELLERALAKSKGTDQNSYRRCSEIRARLRAYAALTRPRSFEEALGKDKIAAEAIFASPMEYLDLLTPDEVGKLINHGFNPADTSNSSYYKLLAELMKPGHVEIAKRVPQLVSHYSSSETLIKRRDRLMGIRDRWTDNPAMTALQMACDSSESNMLMLRLLIEKIKVDVNAQSARSDKDYDDDEGFATREYLSRLKTYPGGTALHVLASGNHYWQLEALEYLLANGADVNAVDHVGRPPLHCVARHQSFRYDHHGSHFWTLATVRILLAHGADPNLLDHDGMSAVHAACGKDKKPEILEELLRAGADMTVGIRSPIFEVISHNNLEVLRILLAHGINRDIVDESRRDGFLNDILRVEREQLSRRIYPLLWSAFSSNLRDCTSLPLLRSLIENGANPYLPLNENETLIHLIFQLGPYRALNTLLEEPCISHVDFNHRDQRGRTVLMAACDWRFDSHDRSSPFPFRPEWVPSSTPGPPLRILDSVQSVDTTLVDDEGRTALHHLLGNPHAPESLVLDFISHPRVATTLFVKDNRGFSPFHCALRILRLEVCSFLLSKGANILEADPDGVTVLHHLAAQCIFRGVAEEGLSLWRQFLEAGGDINCRDKNGNTPLLTYLSLPPGTARGDDPRGWGRDHHGMLAYVSDGKTPAHVAYYSAFFEGPDTNHGVDILARNNDGETALHVVVWRSERSGFNPPEWKDDARSWEDVKRYEAALVEMMLKKGADPIVEDEKGRTAGDVASALGKGEILEVLSGRK